MLILKNYDYPGNIRELENMIERLIVLNKNDNNGVITADDLPSILPVGAQLAGDYGTENGLVNAVENFEKKLIVKALQENNNNKVQTAKELQINRSTFMSKLKKYNIN